MLRGALTGATLGVWVLPLAILLRPWLGQTSLWLLGVTAGGATAPSLAAVAGRALLAVVVAATVGAVFARLRRPDAERWALFFDRQLQSKQAIPAALEDHATSPWAAHLEHTAFRSLAQAPPGALSPRALLPRHFGLPAAFVACVAAWHLPREHTTVELAPAGTRNLQISNLDDLSWVASLEETPGLTAAERRRLGELGARARTLREGLSKGLSQREALAEVTKLQNTVSDELTRLASADERAALEAAVRVMQRQPETLAAAEALREGDLSTFDEEMRRLSASEERASRQRAKEALAEAAVVANADEATVLSRLLAEQTELFDQRADATERNSDLMRELGDPAAPLEPAETGNDPLPEGQRRNRTGANDPGASLEQHSGGPLAERLQGGLEHGVADFQAREAARLEKASRANEGESRQDTSRSLERLREPSPSARRHQALLDAARALARLQNTLSDRAGPLPSAINAPPSAGPPRPESSSGSGSSGPNSRRGDHAGRTSEVDAQQLRAKTHQSLDVRRGRATSSRGRSAARQSVHTLTPTPRAVRSRGPEQIAGVERASIPAEYREQVSRYFSAE